MTKKQLIELVKFTEGETAQPTTFNNEDAESIVDDFIASNSLEKPDNKQLQEFCKHEWKIGNIRHPIGNLRCKKCGLRKWQNE